MVWLAVVLGAGLGLLLGLALGRRQIPSPSTPRRTGSEQEGPAADPRRDPGSLPDAVGAQNNTTEYRPRRPEHDSGADQMGALLRAGLEELPFGGVVLLDAGGHEVLRNGVARQVADGRHNGALVEAAVVELAEAAFAQRQGDPDGDDQADDTVVLQQTLQMYGPPRQAFVLQATRLAEAQQLLGVLVAIEDVTELHRVNEVRRDFVANVSHELKTPVAAISLLAETVAAEHDDETKQRLSRRLESEALRLSNTVSDLLNLSEVESGHLNLGRVEAGALLNTVRERTTDLAARREIIVDWDAPAGLSFDGDHRQLASALGNLVENAIRYSEPGSRVEVRAAVVREEDAADDASPSAERVRVVVADEGIGIPDADRERIFERFYRVDPARSRNTGGTGLGLSIVSHVARRHGGSVTVVSTEGEGSTFVFDLPRDHDDIVADEPLARPKPREELDLRSEPIEESST